MASLPSHFLSLARNNLWSNHRLHEACGRLSSEEYFARRPSFFGSIHACLNHIVIVDQIYLDRLSGRRTVPLDCEELCPDLDGLRREQMLTDRRLIAFCEAQTEPSLSSFVEFTRIDGGAYREQVHNVLAHLFTHQVHHRGQVHDMLCATSVTPPQLDEFFLDGDLDLRRHELERLGLPRDQS